MSRGREVDDDQFVSVGESYNEDICGGLARRLVPEFDPVDIPGVSIGGDISSLGIGSMSAMGGVLSSYSGLRNLSSQVSSIQNMGNVISSPNFLDRYKDGHLGGVVNLAAGIGSLGFDGFSAAGVGGMAGLNMGAMGELLRASALTVPNRMMGEIVNDGLGSRMVGNFEALGDLVSKWVNPVRIEIDKFARINDQLSDYFSGLGSAMFVDSLIRREGFGGFFELWAGLGARFTIPNWVDVKGLDVSRVESVVLGDGIPLAWIPRAETVQLILEAEDTRRRRQVLSNRWRGIILDCEEVLAEVTDPSLVEHVSFCRDVIVSIRNGMWRPAQALAANLLDTVLTWNIDSASVKYGKQGNGVVDANGSSDGPTLDDFESLPFRTAIVMAAVWSAHERYSGQLGVSEVPRKYSRHASVHGVSRRQYTKVNAILSMMHVVSVLRLAQDRAAIRN